MKKVNNLLVAGLIALAVLALSQVTPNNPTGFAAIASGIPWGLAIVLIAFFGIVLGKH